MIPPPATRARNDAGRAKDGRAVARKCVLF